MFPDVSLRSLLGKRVPRILVVDDHPANRDVLSELLTMWGCAVHTAADGDEALGVVKSFDPDTILLDVRMPGRSGFEVCRAIQADPGTRHIPVIFLTALGDDESMVEGLDSGAVDFLSKPIDFAQLAASLRARLRQKHAGDALRAKHADLAEKARREKGRGG